ncbi:formin-like protein 14 [Malania oleifera]|uniref:formin-like protein 14 n=1 Tax=Malania oleifera TaxID=397392 RepID=UPI0025AE69E4|nr:formin-like protein 14 [Malania oleifera]
MGEEQSKNKKRKKWLLLPEPCSTDPQPPEPPFVSGSQSLSQHTAVPPPVPQQPPFRPPSAPPTCFSSTGHPFLCSSSRTLHQPPVPARLSTTPQHQPKPSVSYRTSAIGHQSARPPCSSPLPPDAAASSSLQPFSPVPATAATTVTVRQLQPPASSHGQATCTATTTQFWRYPQDSF